MLAGSLINFSREMLYQMLIQAAIFLLFFLIVKTFFYDKVIEIVDSRQVSINKDIEEARKNREETSVLKQEYETKVERVNEEVSAITNKATLEAKKVKEDIISEARREAADMKVKAGRDIEIAREQAMKDMKDNIIDITFDVANKALAEHINTEAQEVLFKDAIRKIEEAEYE